MLTDMKTLLDIAEEKGCAIPAFNVYNAETALGAIFAAEEANSCVILQMYSRLFSNFEAQFMAPSILEAARNAKVKVAFHLDHGANDEVITKALRWGCTGVMRDASTSPFEENVAILKNVVERAHAVGVSVEGELGHIGVAKDGVSTEYTKVDEAKKFVEETGVDGLAVYVGNSHSRLDEAARLDVSLLNVIEDASPVPLVLHGSSGLDKKDISVLISRGILKVNNYTEVSRAAVSALRNALSIPTWSDYHPLSGIASAAMAKVVEEKLRTFGAVGKA